MERKPGLGVPVDPEVKITKPGVEKKAGAGPEASPDSGSSIAASPAFSSAGANPAVAGVRKTGMTVGNGGSLRHVLGSGWSSTTVAGNADSAKRSANVSGWLRATTATAAGAGGSRSTTRACQPAAITASVSLLQSRPWKVTLGGRSVTRAG